MPRAAIIGCGMIAGLYEDFTSPQTYSHAKAYRTHGAFDKIAVTDADSGRAASLAAKADAEIFGDLDSLLSEFRPDVVSICTPDTHHVSALEQILPHPQAPRLVFCEKPLCSDPEEFARLTRLERDSRTRIIVNHSRRFDPAHRDLSRLACDAEGGLGGLVRGHVDYYGGWRHLGVHVVDILQLILGCDYQPKQASYCCDSKYADDPTLDMVGQFGAAPVRFFGFPESCYQILDINLLFSRGQIRISDFGKQIQVLRQTINDENERVLVLDTAASGPGMVAPMTNAVATIAAYLSDGDEKRLKPYGLVETGRTMETLWKGSVLYAARSL